MRSDLTEIVAIMDRSGSMQSCKKDSEGGLNAFIDAQKKQPGDARLTLVQFDTEVETVLASKPIKEAPVCRLDPRGMTALYDAVGSTIDSLGARLAALPENERPGLVVVVIITDGGENASKDYTGEKVRAMVAHQQEKYSWKFVYIGANQDAFTEASKIGIAAGLSANYGVHKTVETYHTVSDLVSCMRSAYADGADVECAFSAKQRAEML